MKYLAILVLLFAPAMAQDKQPVKGGYIDVLNQMEADDACRDYAALDTPEKLDAYVKGVAADKIAESEKLAILCTGSSAAKPVTRRIASAFILQIERRLRGEGAERIISAMSKERDQDLQSAYDRFDKVKEASERYISLLKEDLAYYRGQSSVTREPVSNSYQQPDYQQVVVAPRPSHCVATSSPLGQSVITGVNCY